MPYVHTLHGLFLFAAFLLGSFHAVLGDELASPLTLGPAEPVPATLYTFNSNLLTATAFHGLTYDGPEFEKAVRVFGFTMLAVGLTIVGLILYTMLFGYR